MLLKAVPPLAGAANSASAPALRVAGAHQLMIANGVPQHSADGYLATQAPMQDAWIRALGLDAATVARDAALVALSDTLSLALCGDLKLPLRVEAPGHAGGTRTLQLATKPGDPGEFTVTPWPFRGASLVVECEARPLPEAGRFESEAAMRAWHAAPNRVAFHARLTPG